MKTIHKVLSSSSLALVAVLAAACGDPVGNPCQSANGDFAVTYELVAKTGSAKCDALVQVGDVVGLTSFNKAGGAGQLPRYDQPGALAIQTPLAGDQLAAYVDGYGATLNPGDRGYAFGNFASAMPVNDLCALPAFTSAHLKFAAIPATPDDPSTTASEADPGLPAFEGTWAWSNVSLLDSADAPGTAFAGTLKTTIPDEDGNACSFEYKTVGLFPAIPCNTNDETKPIADADGNAPNSANWEPTYEQKAFPLACAAEADPDPAKGHTVGSGINPNFRTVCAEFVAGSTYYCVLESAFAKSIFQK